MRKRRQNRKSSCYICRKHPTASVGKSGKEISRAPEGRQTEGKKTQTATPAASTSNTVNTDGLKPQDNTATEQQACDWMNECVCVCVCVCVWTCKIYGTGLTWIVLNHETKGSEAGREAPRPRQPAAPIEHRTQGTGGDNPPAPQGSGCLGMSRVRDPGPRPVPKRTKHPRQPTKAPLYVYVYVFSRRFYPKRLTNKDITSYKR